MEPERRFSPLEYRADSSLVRGVVVRYGDTATVGGILRERFVPGCFGDVRGLDVIANVQHRRDRPLARTGGGGLELSDTRDDLSAALTMPDTRDGQDATELLRLRVLRGFSVEFLPTQERFDAGVRIVEKADLVNIGLVDRPAYGDSLAALAKRCSEAGGQSPAVPRPRGALLWL